MRRSQLVATWLGPIRMDWISTAIAILTFSGTIQPLEKNVLWYMDGKKGSEYSASVTIDPMSGEWQIKSALDFDLDGHQDLLWRNEVTGQNEVWFMGGDRGRDRLSKQEIAGIGSDLGDFQAVQTLTAMVELTCCGETRQPAKMKVWFMGGTRGTRHRI